MATISYCALLRSAGRPHVRTLLSSSCFLPNKVAMASPPCVHHGPFRSLVTGTLYHNPKCSKSRAALDLLQEAEAEQKSPAPGCEKQWQLEVVEYLKKDWSAAEVSALTRQLSLPSPHSWKRKTPDGRAIPDSASSEEAASAMAKDPAFMERPIFEIAGKAVIGRPPLNVLDLLDEALDDPDAGGSDTTSGAGDSQPDRFSHGGVRGYSTTCTIQECAPAGSKRPDSNVQVESGTIVAWEVYRVDNYGIQVPMLLCATEQEAREASDTYEARGHHQGYFVRKRVVSESLKPHVSKPLRLQ